MQSEPLLNRYKSQAFAGETCAKELMAYPRYNDISEKCVKAWKCIEMTFANKQQNKLSWLFYALMLIVIALVSLVLITAREARAAELASTHLIVEDAQGFSITYENNIALLELNTFDTNGSILTQHEYLLLRRGNSVPVQYSDYEVIFTPINSLITSSTTQLSLLLALNSEEVLSAHADTMIWHESLSNRVSSREIMTVGNGASLNTELILGLNPNVYMAVSNDDSNLNSHAVLASSGIGIVYNADYLEPNLLARAEWIKVMALLLEKEDEANAIFTEIKNRYVNLKQLVSGEMNKPLILINSPFRGTWYVPGGNSYMAQLINDAGGEYPWQGNATRGSFIISFEEMLALGLEADIWINPGLNNALLSELSDLDSRLEELRPFQREEVYSYTKRISENGANDYWESGILNPDKILADLIKIFHPQLLPDYDFFYYQKYK